MGRTLGSWKSFVWEHLKPGGQGLQNELQRIEHLRDISYDGISRLLSSSTYTLVSCIC